MKLGVSGWRLSGQPLGVTRYLEYLLRHWNQILGPDDAITLYVCRALAEQQRLGFGRTQIELVEPRLTNALWENLLLPRRARGLDVLFGPSYTLPLTHRGPMVVAIHSANEAGKRFPIMGDWQFEQKYKLAARRAEKIVVNAGSVKKGVVECYGVAPDKVEIVHLAADDVFRPVTDEDLLRATRRRLIGDDRPYVVFVGGLSERRNVPALLKAFSVVKHSERLPHALLFVGPNRANVPLHALAGELGIADSVIHTDGHFERHSELVPIYGAADVYVLPSSSDGFSLTLIEAMSCGVPVVTVNRGACGEVAHGHAVTVDDPSVDALAEALRIVLTDASFRRTIGMRCLERSRDFSWNRTARSTFEILRGVA